MTPQKELTDTQIDAIEQFANWKLTAEPGDHLNKDASQQLLDIFRGGARSVQASLNEEGQLVSSEVKLD